jgi:excisionase family DNA binding protein
VSKCWAGCGSRSINTEAIGLFFLKEVPVDKLALSIAETSEALNVHPNTVRELIKTGRLPAVQVGGRRGGKWLIAREAVIGFLHGQVA